MFAGAVGVVLCLITIMRDFGLRFTLLFIPMPGAIALATTNITLAKNSTSLEIAKQGWTSQPDGRGTLDILWSCVLTMSLCSWSIMCLNVPGRSESNRQVLWRKFCLTILGILIPDQTLVVAMGQWLSARQSVMDFNTDEFRAKLADSFEWGMKEAFFADMGGFLLQTYEERDFPLNAKQLHFLVSKGYLPPPSLDRREIEERNKVDIFLRIITLGQIIWFLINAIGRLVQHLVITAAELTTVCFILCNLGTAFFWWHKPADAKIGKIIENKVSLEEIFRKERRGAYSPNDWSLTPLDFVDRNEWWYARLFANGCNILRHMHFTFGSNNRPVDRISDTLQKELSRPVMFLILSYTIGFFSVLFVAWNSSFPTHVEQTLWRASCLMTVAVALLSMIGSIIWSSPAMKLVLERYSLPKSPQISRLEDGFGSTKWARSKNTMKRVDSWLECIRNNSLDKDPQLRTPLKLVLPIYIIASFYFSGRLYIIIADILELRSLPANAYATVNWMKSLPHLG